MIKEHIRGHKHFSVFRMTEALSRKELLPALEILDHQLQSTPRETRAPFRTHHYAVSPPSHHSQHV